jgi:ABC-type nickel/cobalt efflux system permease component RcnA
MPRPIRLCLLLLGLALPTLLLGAPRTGAAPVRHPAPSILHDYIVTLTPRMLTVQSYLRVSPELVPEVYRQIDRDQDGRTSDAERAAWFQTHPARLSVALDGTPQKAEISPAPPLSREDLLVSISHPVAVTYTVALDPPVSGKHRIALTYGDNYLDYDEYYVSVAGDLTSDGKPHGVASAKYPATYQIVYLMPPSSDSTIAAGQLAPPPFTAPPTPTPGPVPLTPTPLVISAPAGPVVAAAPPPPPSSSNAGPVLDGLRNWRGEIWSGLAMLLLALGLGALHALTPGHGKAMVAAYLIGSRGRVRDAALLGGVVTLTHTLGVVLLGLVLLFANALAWPRALQPALELASGLLIVGLGAYLLVTRWRALPARRAPATTIPVRPVAVPALSTAGAATAMHAHAQDHAHPHDHDHDHDRAHGPDHGHSHGGHSHSHALPGDRVSTRALVGLGISGGLVPCPDALAILLLAAGVGQIGLGLGLVTAFSVGLAAVLIGIGIALVTMKGALERSGAARLATNPLWTRWVPVASAGVVVLVGLLLVTAALGAAWG